jgi:hypothetical protein
MGIPAPYKLSQFFITQYLLFSFFCVSPKAIKRTAAKIGEPKNAAKNQPAPFLPLSLAASAQKQQQINKVIPNGINKIA